MLRWARATGFITGAFGVDFCGGERRGGDEEPILRRSSIRIFTSPYLRKRSGEVPGACAGLRSKENGRCHKTTVLVSGVSSFGRRGATGTSRLFFQGVRSSHTRRYDDHGLARPAQLMPNKSNRPI